MEFVTLHNTLQYITLSFILTKDTSYLNQRINNDSNAIIIFCISALQNIVINIMMFVIPLIMLLSFNVYLALMFVILVGIYYVSYRALRNPLLKVCY